jgi:hypothetical protein
MPDVSQMTPATGRVGAPASGTYGEKAALADTMAALPAPTPGLTPPGADRAPSGAGGPLPLSPPSGALPRSIGAPSTRPHEPMATPLTQPMPIAEEPSMQLRQQVEAWAHDPQRSDTFRAWAQSILNRMEPA